MASERVNKSLIDATKYLHIRDFVQLLVFNSYSMTTILEEDDEIDRKQFSFVFFEHVNFFMFLLDRAASSRMDIQTRSTLMREVTDFAFVLSIVTLLPRLQGHEKDKLYDRCMRNLIALIEEYSKYDLIPIEDEGAHENTALWEFSKKIQEFTKDPYNLGGMVGYQFQIIQAMKNIDINSFLEKMK